MVVKDCEYERAEVNEFLVRKIRSPLLYFQAKLNTLTDKQTGQMNVLGVKV